MDVAHIADDLLTQMYHNSKKPGGPAGGLSMPNGPAVPVAATTTAVPATR